MRQRAARVALGELNCKARVCSSKCSRKCGNPTVHRSSPDPAAGETFWSYFCTPFLPVRWGPKSSGEILTSSVGRSFEQSGPIVCSARIRIFKMLESL
jgi:hypothetical protein